MIYNVTSAALAGLVRYVTDLVKMAARTVLPCFVTLKLKKRKGKLDHKSTFSCCE